MSRLLPGYAYIVERSNHLLSSEFPESSTYDQIFITAGETPVKDLRQAISRFYEQPSAELRLLVINQAHRLEELHQNTLLKTLEEPPSKGAVVLQANSVDSLLPTVRSRLHKLNIKSDLNSQDIIVSTENLDRLYTEERPQVIEDLRSIQRSLSLSDSMYTYRHKLLDDVLLRLGQNTNLKLTIDYLILNWEPQLGKE